ncbi:MAG TPA: HDOD domain-containing protein [Rhodocyclaceae bacterium]|nr:HDOD domain-containing protein [Rhodocyclaceae bacterium]
MTLPAHPLDLTGWIERIRGRDMPVFGRTVESLRTLLSDDRVSASTLAQVILKDAPMTAKVLRLANSAFFNTSRQTVSTVSRAIVVLGFNPVAQIALSVSLIDALLSGGVRGRAEAEMARSFHAAVQARWAAAKRGEGHGEEVFIAALLTRVGEMAFWCFGGDQARSLDGLLAQGRMREEDAQQVVLGFPLRHLSAGLVREWHLGALAQAVLEGQSRGRNGEQAVLLGHRLACASEQGWDAPPARQAVQALADYLELPFAAVLDAARANAAEAARIANSFGAPAPPAGAAASAGSGPAQADPAAPPVGVADPHLQLHILHDVAAMTLAQAPLDDILQMVLEGLYRGVGCERVLVARLSADRSELQGRAAIGSGAEALAASFVFSMDGEPDDLLDAAIDSAQGCWLTPSRAAQPGAERLLKVAGSRHAYLAPFGTGSRQVGVFYADGHGRALDEAGWHAFQHFVLQASLAVGLSLQGQ